MSDKPENAIVIKYEVPLTWLLATAGGVALALFYAGWQAADLKTQLENAVRLGKEVMQRQDTLAREIMDLKVKDQLADAKIVQLEQRLVKVEK